MHQFTAVLAVLASVAVAQNTELQIFFPGGYEGVDPVASVVTANPSTTVLDISCPTGIDSTECGFGTDGFEYSIISTTIIQATISEANLFTLTLSCQDNTKAQEKTCVVRMGGSEVTDDTSPTTTVLPSAATDYITATITAGAERLGQSGNASQAPSSTGIKTSVTGGASSTGSPSSTGTPAAPSQTSSQGTTVTGTPSGSGAPPENSNAAFRYRAEGSALFALAGAAVLNVL